MGGVSACSSTCVCERLRNGLWQCRRCHTVAEKDSTGWPCSGVVAAGMVKKCPHCLQVKPLTVKHWYRHSRNHDGFQARCKECHNQYKPFSRTKLTSSIDRLARNGHNLILIDVQAGTAKPLIVGGM